MAGVQAFRRLEVLEILVVGKDGNLVLTAHQFRPPLLKGTNYSQHLLIVDIVVPLRRVYLLRVVRERLLDLLISLIRVLI